MFASYDSEADIAWFPTGESDDVVSERVAGGLRDYDRAPTLSSQSRSGTRVRAYRGRCSKRYPSRLLRIALS
jgi:hypothetical protein